MNKNHFAIILVISLFTLLISSYAKADTIQKEGANLTYLPIVKQLGFINRLSQDDGGTQGNGFSNKPAISADGRYIAFHSEADNLVPNDTNNAFDIFVYDQQTRQMKRVSISSSGTEGNGNSFYPSISADGRYIVFQSLANNFVVEDPNNGHDIYIHDSQLGLTTLVSATPTGSVGNDSSTTPAISANGRYIVFVSRATNLGGEAGGYFNQVYVYDRETLATVLISKSSNGTIANHHASGSSLSANGRYVAFWSFANNLVANDTNGMIPDVFIHDLQLSQTSRVSVASDGSEGNRYSVNPSISANGRYVSFESNATNFVFNDNNNKWDVFVHDRETGQTILVSISLIGLTARGNSTSAVITDDGRYVVFESYADNLVDGDTNGTWDVFIHELLTGETRRVSIGYAGDGGNARSHWPTISADGRYVAFDSEASNLVWGDTNGVSDIFLFDLLNYGLQN